jgi:hypothetical protein
MVAFKPSWSGDLSVGDLDQLLQPGNPFAPPISVSTQTTEQEALIATSPPQETFFVAHVLIHGDFAL